MTARTSVDIRLIEAAGKHYVSLLMDGCELERRGPFRDSDAAQAAAARLTAFCRGVFPNGVQTHRVVPTPRKRQA